MSCGYVNSQANFNMPCEHLRIYVDGKDQLWTKTKYVGFQGKCPHTMPDQFRTGTNILPFSPIIILGKVIGPWGRVLRNFIT